MEREFADSVHAGEEDLRLWASQHLNVEIGIALHTDRWEGADDWLDCEVKEIADLDEFLDRCEVVTAGVDGGGLDDLLGLVLMGREKDTQRWLMWCMGCCHEVALERRKEIAEALRGFQEDGDLVICEHVSDDVISVADVIEQVLISGLFPEKNAIGLDPVGVAAILDELKLRGITDEQMVSVPQGYRLSGVTKGMARKLHDGSMVHGGQPIMTWCVSNAKTELRGNAVYVTKQASGSMKIDLLIAAFNAFDLMSRHPVAAGAGLVIPEDYEMCA
jgi:phage terminase large subunit-like protein